MFFRKLDEAEGGSFRKWARDNYKPGDPIQGFWHPVVRAEAEKMNLEIDRIVDEAANG